jgi:hypothetical protein
VNDKLWTHGTCEIWSAHSGTDNGYCLTRCDAANNGQQVLKCQWSSLLPSPRQSTELGYVFIGLHGVTLQDTWSFIRLQGGDWQTLWTAP